MFAPRYRVLSGIFLAVTGLTHCGGGGARLGSNCDTNDDCADIRAGVCVYFGDMEEAGICMAVSENPACTSGSTEGCPNFSRCWAGLCFPDCDVFCDTNGECDSERRCVPTGEVAPQTCPGYSGTDTDCCRTDNPCGYSNNGSCDCDGTCAWDSNDCGTTALDILVVMDNSMTMAEEQENLAAAFPALITSLLDPAGEHVTLTDLHIGVVSTDMGTGGYTIETCTDPIDGDNGELQHEPNPTVSGCEPSYPSYLPYESAEPDSTVIGEMATAFGCISQLGTTGCGWEQQLKAAGKALIDHRDGVNAGFLRPDSILAILFVTDEEDCSVAPGSEGIFDALDSSLGHLNLRCFLHPYMVEPVETYVSAFRGLRAYPDDLVLAFLVGVPLSDQCQGAGDAIPNCLDHPNMVQQVDPVSPTSLVPSCETATGRAYPPRRFVQVAQQFGDAALVQSICTDDFAPAIQLLTDKLHAVIDM